MRTLSEKLIATLFNNPLGRWYLGVPKGKKIYKITRSSAHYYTGEIAKNGMPVICTGEARPNGRNPFIYWLETWKPIHLCWLFIRMGWKIPKYFIGLDTGAMAPAATGGKYNTWTDPTNAYANDGNYATRVDNASQKQSYENFGFSIPAGSTIDGIELTVEAHVDTVGQIMYVNVYNKTSTAWATAASWNKPGLTDAVNTQGGATSKWGKTWSDSDLSDANFSAYIATGGDGGNIILYVDYLTVKVYYTEAAPAPNEWYMSFV